MDYLKQLATVEDITDDFHKATKDVPKRYGAELYTSFISSSTDTFKIVYDKKQLNNQHYKTFEVLAAANIAKNTILKSFYTDGHKRTFKKENLNKVIEIIELNAKN